MISSILKQVMDALGFKQADLARELGVSLDRVKSLTSGRAAKLTAEEGRTLVEQLNVSGYFLTTGNGPVMQPRSEIEFKDRLKIVSATTGKVMALGLPQSYATFVQEVVALTEFGDGNGVRECVDRYVVERVSSSLARDSSAAEPQSPVTEAKPKKTAGKRPKGKT